MKKNTPHSKLATVKALVQAENVRTTQSALIGAASLGLNFDDMLAVIMNLSHADFYKSMTTHANHQIWQDV